MFLGAQNSGCQFNKKPRYRYSGCHWNDASALSIVLGQYFNYSIETYSQVNHGNTFRDISRDEANFEISMLLQNNTNKFGGSKWSL